jgi:hypothetical protein
MSAYPNLERFLSADERRAQFGPAVSTIAPEIRALLAETRALEDVLRQIVEQRDALLAEVERLKAALAASCDEQRHELSPCPRAAVPPDPDTLRCALSDACHEAFSNGDGHLLPEHLQAELAKRGLRIVRI